MSIPSTSSSLPLNTTWEDVTRDNRASLVRVRSSQWFGDYSKYSTLLLWKVDVNGCSLLLQHTLPLERRDNKAALVHPCLCLSASVTTCSLLFPMTTCSILPNATWEEAIGDNRAVIVLVRSSQCFGDYSMMSMTVPHRWHTPWKQSTPCACARADLTPILTTCLPQCFNLQRRKYHFLISLDD